MRRGDEGEERVQLARERPWMVAVTMEACCARILKRHRAAIRVQKADVAIANLARIIDATLKLSNKKGFHATSLRELAKSWASAWAASIPTSTTRPRSCR